MDAAADRVYITGFDLFLLTSLIAHYTVWDKMLRQHLWDSKRIFLCHICDIARKQTVLANWFKLQGGDGPMLK